MLVVVCGPPGVGKTTVAGMIAERLGAARLRTDVVREHLQGQCGIGEVNIGIALQSRNLASVTTLLTYRREDVRRIDEIEETAEAYEEETQALVT